MIREVLFGLALLGAGSDPGPLLFEVTTSVEAVCPEHFFIYEAAPNGFVQEDSGPNFIRGKLDIFCKWDGK